MKFNNVKKKMLGYKKCPYHQSVVIIDDYLII